MSNRFGFENPAIGTSLFIGDVMTPNGNRCVQRQLLSNMIPGVLEGHASYGEASWPIA